MEKQEPIKRKDLIDDEAINFPKKYAKNLKKAIKANKKFKKTMNKIRDKYFYSPIFGFIQLNK